MSVCQATAARCQGGRRLQPAGHPRATAADGRPAPGRFLAAKWQIISRRAQAEPPVACQQAGQHDEPGDDEASYGADVEDDA